MITRILHLVADHPFGRMDNPLWQVADSWEKPAGDVDRLNPWLYFLIPFETLTERRPESKLSFPARAELQIFISQENLTHSLLRESLQSGRRIQIWIDRKISKEEALILEPLLKAHETLDMVYLPDLHSHPEQVFENLQSPCKLLVHLKAKRVSFDRWLTPFEIWDRILWLRDSQKFSVIGTQIFESQLSDCATEAERLFLLNPTYGNLMFHLQNHDKIKYWTQVSTRTFFGISRPGFVLFLRLVLGTLLKPTRKNLFQILRSLLGFLKNLLVTVRNSLVSLKNHIVFYPFRKAYWMIEYAVKKRILKK